MTPITHKNRVDKLIQMMVPKGVGASLTHPADNGRTIEDHDGNVNGDVVSEGGSDVGSFVNFED